MFNLTVIQVQQNQFQRYCEAFNFFQSKSINLILSQRKLDYVVHFRDLEYLDDETQYFKRYYVTHETTSRIRKLISYYQNNMTPPTPNLLTIDNFHVLDNRNRKILKLCLMKQKSLGKKVAIQEDLTSEQMILSQLNHSDMSLAQSYEKDQGEDDCSYDSQPHCVFDNEDDLLQSSNAAIQKMEKQEDDYVKPMDLKNLGQSELIIDFRYSNQVIMPQVVPYGASASMSSGSNALIQMQSVPKQTNLTSNQNSQQSKKSERQKNSQFFLEKKESKEHQNTQSLQKILSNQNIVLTQSIQVKKEEKKKPSSFMEYYNSIPVKSPSNILQKYIKRKK